MRCKYVYTVAILAQATDTFAAALASSVLSPLLAAMDAPSPQDVVFIAAMRLGATWSHLLKDLRGLEVLDEYDDVMHTFSRLLQLFVACIRPSLDGTFGKIPASARTDVVNMFTLLATLANLGSGSFDLQATPFTSLPAAAHLDSYDATTTSRKHTFSSCSSSSLAYGEVCTPTQDLDARRPEQLRDDVCMYVYMYV